MSQFKVVGIMARVKNPGVIETVETLIHYLQTLNQPLIVEAETAQALQRLNLPSAARDTLGEVSQLVIVVGGDGSLLQAAHAVVDYGTPVLGVNRGRLGFLTDIHPKKLEQIKDILDGNFRLEKRFLLSATVTHEGKTLGQSAALNEVALIPDSVPHMNEFEIYIDDQFVCSQNSDGVIIATPTGSTAYALSGGGPILHPQLDAIEIVPMFPHSLSIRPLVIAGNHVITIAISPTNTAIPRLTCDGQAFISTPPGTKIRIAKKEKCLNLIHPVGYDYYETLRSKLHWGHKLH
ncbi:MAG: NAD(+) kinase [Gammaproteobacteria bacterium]|nr:NAD(+) kinase [Gammaproteobacteria bacterium]